MSTILLLSVDKALGELHQEIANEHDWSLTVWPEAPPDEHDVVRFDLVIFDARTAPNSKLTFMDVGRIMHEVGGSLRAGRILVLSPYEDLVGRINTFVNGGSAHLRIHAITDPPEPDLTMRLANAILDALSLPAYERVDFHDNFPNRDFYRQVFESIQVPILILSGEGAIKLMNLRALARFHYNTQMVLNNPWTMMIAPVDRGKPAEDFFLRISGGYFYEGTLRFVDRQGKEFPALVTSSRVFSDMPDSELLIALTIYDLTEMEELQRQVTTLQKMESVERVVAGMTHEFNNMLTAILGHAELLTEDLETGSEVHHSAVVIRREAERAQDLTARMLGLSSSRQFMPVPISCRDVVSETVALLLHSLGDRIKVETHLLELDDMIEGDAAQLRQVLVNLCLNARDAMNGQGVISIRTSIREVLPEECRLHQDWTPGVFVEIAVKDTGCGIAPEAMDRLFEPFYTTKPAGAGTGLGLSVVRGMVLTHGGHVAIESAPKRGTTVMVRLPQSAAQAGPIPSLAEATAQPAPGHGEQILVVDDDRAVLTFAQKVLARSGYRVRLAIHGQLAIDLLKRHGDEMALVLLDLTMPGTSGRDVLNAIRRNYPDMPVILSTGFAAGGLDDDLVNQVQGFLKKPYRPRDLVGLIGEVLESPGES